MTRTIEVTVDEAYDGKKLKVFMRGRVKTSAATLNKLKNDPMGLLLNGAHVRTIDPVHTGDVLTINLPEEENGIPVSDFSDLNILYEDEDLLVLNKPSGIAMHPTHNHQGDTLANKVAGYLASKGKNAVFRAVGRLDKCTSGLVIIALNRHAASRLADTPEKEYIALVEGEYLGSGTIDKNIYRPDPMKTLRAADETGTRGENAVTHWTAIGGSGDISVLRIRLETGRTHQIRVHFASLGTPLIGDEMYGSERTECPRAALHCAHTSFVHPVTGAPMDFDAPLPPDMKQIFRRIMKD